VLLVFESNIKVAARSLHEHTWSKPQFAVNLRIK